MSSMVVYCSKYGSAKNYAEKLAQDMNWVAKAYKRVKRNELKGTDAIVLISNVRIGKMGLKSWVKSNRNIIKPKVKAVICVGGAPVEHQDYYQGVIEENLGFLELKKEQLFGLGGRQVISEYKGFDAFMFKMLDKMIKDPKQKDDMMKDKNHINMKDVNRIVEYLKT